MGKDNIIWLPGSRKKAGEEPSVEEKKPAPKVIVPEIVSRFKKDPNARVGLDMEMSGLTREDERIFEVAFVIADRYWNIFEKGPHIVIYQNPEVWRIALANPFIDGHFIANGLLDESRNSTHTEGTAETIFLEWLNQVSVPGKPLYGNSVHVDRQYLKKYMPRVDAFFSHRTRDFSERYEDFQERYPEDAKKLPRFDDEGASHRAPADAMKTLKQIGWLKRYRPSQA
ncbi:MAG: orn [Candidatus Nomurabacteria bacterium]|nr:orn [Candidatus Nomurabacteria bacterium]